MASIYKRGKTWWVHYYVNGKSVDRSLRTRNERVARDWKKKLEAADVVGQLDEPSSTSIEVVVEDYCQYLVATRPRKSAKNDSSNLRAFFGPCCPALQLGSRVPHKYRDNKRQLPTVPDKLVKRHVPVRRLEQITAEMINQYLLDRVVEDGLKPKTVNRLREALRSLFNFAVEHKGYVCPDRRYPTPSWESAATAKRHRSSPGSRPMTSGSSCRSSTGRRPSMPWWRPSSSRACVARRRCGSHGPTSTWTAGCCACVPRRFGATRGSPRRDATGSCRSAMPCSPCYELTRRRRTDPGSSSRRMGCDAKWLRTYLGLLSIGRIKNSMA